MRWRTVSGEGFESAGLHCCMPHQPHTVAPAAPTSPAAANSTPGFVRALGVGVGRGAYPPALLSEWHRWDAEHASENDPVDVFGQDQLYTVRFSGFFHTFVGWQGRDSGGGSDAQKACMYGSPRSWPTRPPHGTSPHDPYPPCLSHQTPRCSSLRTGARTWSMPPSTPHLTSSPSSCRSVLWTGQRCLGCLG